MGDEAFFLGEPGRLLFSERGKPEFRHQRGQGAFERFRRHDLAPRAVPDFQSRAPSYRAQAMVVLLDRPGWHPQTCQRGAEGTAHVSFHRDEEFAAGQRREMSDVRLEAVFPDQQNGDPPAHARESLHVERMALAIGDQQQVAGRRLPQHPLDRPADLGPAAGGAKPRHQRTEAIPDGSAVARCVFGMHAADAFERRVEFPKIEIVRSNELRRHRCEGRDRQLMLARMLEGPARHLRHRAGAVNKEGDAQRPVAVWFRRYEQFEFPALRRHASQRLTLRTLDDQVDRSIEWHLSAAVDEIAAEDLHPTLRRAQDKVGPANRATDQHIVGVHKRRGRRFLRPSSGSGSGLYRRHGRDSPPSGR